MRVIAGSNPALLFEKPLDVLRASTPPDVWNALQSADRALRAGYYIAGYLPYELGMLCVDLPLRERPSSLLALGIYEKPRTIALESARDFAVGPLLARTTRAQYDQAVSTIRSAIREGDVYQVNFTLPFDFSFSGDPYKLYGFLAERSGAAYSAYVEDGPRTLVSLSPELFLRFEPDKLVTKPMKGTSELDSIADLSSEKNRAEHVMIVDLLRNDLHRISDAVSVERLFQIERYPTFATMTSTISAAIRDEVSLERTVRAVFPCGSVTGAPKRAAMQAIAQLESYPRDAYTGSIGFLTPQRTGWWNVAIRTLQIDRDAGTGRLDAGGGIVSDSTPAQEWQEVLLKTRFVHPAIEPFACLETLHGGSSKETVSAHLRRLRETTERLCIPFDEQPCWEEIESFAQSRKAQLLRVRVGLDGNATFRIEDSEEPRARVCLADARVRSSDPMLAYKTSWRPAHEAAAHQARSRGCFDALLRNERDEITEGSRTNVFVSMQGRLFTPPLSSGVLPGILRSELIDSGAAAERILYESDLENAEGIFLGSSARGLFAVQLVRELRHV